MKQVQAGELKDMFDAKTEDLQKQIVKLREEK